MRIVGIDPGRKGGLVAIGDRDPEVLRMPLPKKGKGICGETISQWLLYEDPDLVVIEHQGPRNMFNARGVAVRKAGNEWELATGYGLLQGIVLTQGLKCRKVQPLAWKSAVLAGTDMDKTAAIDFILRYHPEINITPAPCRTPQDGLADAACIALWGQQQYEGN